MRKRNYILLTIALLIIGGFFFGFYRLRFLYYEESGTDKIANYFSFPFLILLGLFILISEYISTKKRWRFSAARFIKQIAATIIGIVIVHLFIARPVISGLTLFINANIGNQKESYLQGIIIDKHEFSSSKGANFYLIISDIESNNTYKFGTFGTETSKYKINDRFEKKMYKGSLRLMYIKN